MTLRTRVALAAAAAVAVVVVLATSATYVLVRDQLRGEVDDSLRGRARAFAALGIASREQAPRPFPDLPVEPVVRLGGAGSYVQMVTSSGRVIAPPGASGTVRIPVTPETIAVARGRRDAFLVDTTVAHTHVRMLTSRVADGVAVQAVRPLNEIDRTLSRTRMILLIVAAGGIALAAALAAVVTRASLAPVRRLTNAAEQVSQTLDLSHRIEVVGDDEPARLAASFNRMLERLERSIGAQRQLVADASHELRTPITTVRMNIELLAREDVLPEVERERLHAATLGQLDDMTTLVSEILELARGDSQQLEPEDVRLDDLLEDAVERARAAWRGIVFETHAEPTLVRGVPSRLARAIANLLDNAAKWSTQRGTIEVKLCGGQLSVRDHGPGIEEADLPHVFDRFYRAAAARSKPGAGLGLAIVRQVADDHGGTISAENAPGGGALLRLRLPAVAIDASLPELGATS